MRLPHKEAIESQEQIEKTRRIAFELIRERMQVRLVVKHCGERRGADDVSVL